MKPFYLLRIFGVVVALLMLPFSSVQAQTDEFDGAVYYVFGSQTVNARSCPRLTCGIVTTIEPGETLEVLDSVQGDVVSGTSLWFRAIVDGVEVYVHSSLVMRQSGETGKPAQQEPSTQSADSISTEDWIRYDAPGMSMEAPSAWLNFTGNAAVISYLSVGMENDASATFQNQLLNAVFVVDPESGIGVRLQGFYSGRDMPLGVMETNVRENLRSNGFEVIESSIVNLPAGKAVRVDYGVRSEDSQSETYECVEYVWFVDRVEFDLYGYNMYGGLTEDQIALIETMANSVIVTSPADQRRGLADHAGSAHQGENDGVLQSGRSQLWTYYGEAGEMVTIRIEPDRPLPNGPDTYLIVRTPSGEILAENDDWSRTEYDPCIDQLKLPETGIYEIEVHSYAGYRSGEYALIIGDQVTPAATNQLTSWPTLSSVS